MTPVNPNAVRPTPEESAAIDAAIADDPDTWEATGPLVPIAEADPELLEAYRAGKLALPRRLGKEHPKTRVTIRLDADIVERLRADGPGWQTRANAALREAVLGS